MTNQVVIRMAKDLKKASIKNDAQIWAKLAKYALKPSIARRDINLKRIGQLTKENDTVVCPGRRFLEQVTFLTKLHCVHFQFQILLQIKSLVVVERLLVFQILLSRILLGKE